MPNTGNVGLEVPTTGSLSGTWGSDALNPDFIAIDGLLGGSVSIALSSTPVTLAAPAGKSIAPAAGPVQSQNKMLVFTGALLANVTVTLPLPGHYLIDNQTTGAFVITLRGATAATKVIGLPLGFTGSIFNDGSNVKFIDLGKAGDTEMWAGLSAMPAWVAACTVLPYLLCDGTVYNVSDYPALGARMTVSSGFGGNGVTTFGVPDLRGRVPLAYDASGARITTAGCGINGQTLGASGGVQSVILDTTQMPSHTHTATVTDPGHTHTIEGTAGANYSNGGNGMDRILDGNPPLSGRIGTSTTGVTVANTATGGDQAHSNVQPSQVTGIWVIKT